MNSAVGRKKDRNIRRDPRVVVSVHSQDDPYTWTRDQRHRGLDRDGRRGRGAHRLRSTRSTTTASAGSTCPGSVRVLYRIRPDRIHRGSRRWRTQPLAARMRPRTFEEFVGQTHLVGEGKALTKLVGGGNLPSIILWGPAGTGKTTLAHLLARRGGRRPDAALGGALGRRRRAQGDGGREGRALPHGAVRRRGPPLVEGAAGRAAARGRGGDRHADRRHHREPVLLAEHPAAVALPAAAAGAARPDDAARRSCAVRSDDPERGLGEMDVEGRRRGARPSRRDRRRRRADGAHGPGGGRARREGCRRARDHARSSRRTRSRRRPSSTTARATPTTT